MKRFLRYIIDKFGEYRLYFLRGYIQYFALLISITSHSLIIYNFVIANTFLSSFFNRFTFFFLSFVSLLIPISIIIGKLDMKKGSFKKEQETLGENSPLWTRLYKEIDELKKQNRDLFEERFDKRISNLLNNLPEDEELRRLIKRKLRELTK